MNHETIELEERLNDIFRCPLCNKTIEKGELCQGFMTTLFHPNGLFNRIIDIMIHINCKDGLAPYLTKLYYEFLAESSITVGGVTKNPENSLSLYELTIIPIKKKDDHL